MVIEIGLFRVAAPLLADFESIAADIRAAFAREVIPGRRSFHMAHADEDPGRWVVVVGWDSTADHRRFVESPEGRRQGDLLAPFLYDVPEVLHYNFDGVAHGLV